MMDQPTHTLTLLQRQKLTMNGVAEVISLDEHTVVLHTDLGTLTVQGQDLHLKTLSLDGGQVEIDGTVSSLIYEEPRTVGSWLSRLLQ